MGIVEDEQRIYIEKGKKLLPKDKWPKWEKTVKERISSIWDGLELTHFLQIQTILVNNKKGSFEEAKRLIDSQGHTGASWNTICKLISSFSEDGASLVDYLNMD